MFGKTVSFEEDQAVLKSAHSKRRFPRRQNDCCVAIVNGQMHPVENWSTGGVLITADERLFSIDQTCVITLKFKLSERVVEIDHKGKISRKAPNKVALKLMPLTKDVQIGFQKVVDDFVSQSFAESQTEH